MNAFDFFYNMIITSGEKTTHNYFGIACAQLK